MQYDAYIAAGGRCPWLQAGSGTEYRCLAKLNGRRMVDYIIDALKSSGCIRRIIVAASPEAAAQLEGTLPDDVLLCSAATDLAGTACEAARILGADDAEMLLGVCDDIPLLTAAAVRDFLAQCAQYPAKELFYPIIPREICLKNFPEAKRTYGKLADGVFTGGNMMLMSRNVIFRGQQQAREIFARRKSPLSLANWLGWSFIFKLIFHRLSIKSAEERFAALTGIDGKAIITCHAGIGMDIDKPEDLELAAKYLN